MTSAESPRIVPHVAARALSLPTAAFSLALLAGCSGAVDPLPGNEPAEREGTGRGAEILPASTPILDDEASLDVVAQIRRG
jgi:hypothetical protein